MSDKVQPQFVDTNVLVYAHDRIAGSKGDAARVLLEELWRKGCGCLSVQVLQELYVTLTQKVAMPMTREQAREVVASLNEWRVHVPDAADVLDAIDLQRRHQVSFWDAMILLSANKLGCSILWTEDLQAGRMYDDVLVKSPFANTPDAIRP